MPSDPVFFNAKRIIKKMQNSLADLDELIEQSMAHFTPVQMFILDDEIQSARRTMTASADRFRQWVIGCYLERLDMQGGKPANIVRPTELVSELKNVPAEFRLQQQYKTKVRNEPAVVEKLLHWAGGDPQAVFHSGEGGALRANPWRTTLIEEACGRQYITRTPDGEPKVCAISDYAAKKKGQDNGCE
jgi:hypothetical protein